MAETTLLKWLAGAAFVASGACSGNQHITKAGSNSYRIRCDTSLARCLEQVERVCPDGFELEDASEQRQRHGVDAVGTGVDTKKSSEALVVCDSEALFRPGDESVLTREPGCTPGESQSCIGPGGCRGGQACLGDGTGYGPCDCAGPSAASGAPSAAAVVEPQFPPGAASAVPAPTATGSAPAVPTAPVAAPKATSQAPAPEPR